MKTSVLILFALLTTGSLFSQIDVQGEKVRWNKQHVFNIVSNGYKSEMAVTSKSGDVLLAFVPFKVPNGWLSQSSSDDSGYRQRSGTSFSYYFQVTDTAGNYTDVPIGGLLNTRNVAKFVITFGLVQNDALNTKNFAVFCQMHGKILRELKNFE